MAGFPFYSIDAFFEIEHDMIEGDWNLMEYLLRTLSNLAILVPGDSNKIKILFCESKGGDPESIRMIANQYFQLIGKNQTGEKPSNSVREEIKEESKHEDVAVVEKEEPKKEEKEIKEEKAVENNEEVDVEQPVRQSVKQDFVKPTTKQINFVRDLMVRSGFSQGLVEKFIELMSREEASQMIDYLKSKKKSSAIELINEVVGRGLEDSEENVQSGEETDLKGKDLITENVGAEEEIEEFDEEELPW